jgi:uncharacterized membrane protein YfcA
VVHALRGHVAWTVAIAAGTGAVLGAQIGVKIARRTQGSAVLRALSLALLLVGIRLLWG